MTSCRVKTPQTFVQYLHTKLQAMYRKHESTLRYKNYATRSECSTDHRSHECTHWLCCLLPGVVWSVLLSLFLSLSLMHSYEMAHTHMGLQSDCCTQCSDRERPLISSDGLSAQMRRRREALVCLIRLPSRNTPRTECRFIADTWGNFFFFLIYRFVYKSWNRSTLGHQPF